MSQLHHVEMGAGDPAILMLHGFAGSGLAMAGLSAGLSAQRQVVAVDLVGHGASPAPASVSAYSTSAMIDQVSDVLTALDLGQVDVLGYSMGARLALQVAVVRPELVRRVVVIGANPGIENQTEREARVRSDAALADTIETDGVEAFVDRWEALPLFDSQHALGREVRAEIRAHRLDQRKIGLANSLRGFGAGSMPPLWERLGSCAVPTLAMAGQLDIKYSEIARRLAVLMPDGASHLVAGVGHAAHLEDNDAVVALVSEFLCR